MSYRQKLVDEHVFSFILQTFFAWREEVYIWMIFCFLSYIFNLFATNFVKIVKRFPHFSYVDADCYTLCKLNYRILNRSKQSRKGQFLKLEFHCWFIGTNNC